jgi:hypothetical protein
MPILRFTRVWNGYAACEEAFFDRDLAAEIVAKGAAEFTNDADAEELAALVAEMRARRSAGPEALRRRMVPNIDPRRWG